MGQSPPLGLKVCTCFSDFQPCPPLQKPSRSQWAELTAVGRPPGLHQADGSQLSLNHHRRFPAQPPGLSSAGPSPEGCAILNDEFPISISCTCAVPLLGPALLLDGMSTGNLLGCKQTGRKILVAYVQLSISAALS